MLKSFWKEWGFDLEDLANFAGAGGIALLLYLFTIFGGMI